MKVSENLEVSLFILQSDVQKKRLSPSQQKFRLGHVLCVVLAFARELR